MTSEPFERALNELLFLAEMRGERFVDVSALDLQRRVGGQWGTTTRLPACCNAMRRTFDPAVDLVMDDATGPYMTFRYFLPR